MSLSKSSVSPGRNKGRATSCSSLGSLTVTVSNLPGLLAPPAIRSQWRCPGNGLGPLEEYRPYPKLPPNNRMLVAASEGEPELSGENDRAMLLPKHSCRGYTEIPSVERSVAMQLCPNSTSTWRGKLCLPSRACKYSSGLTSSAYVACG